MEAATQTEEIIMKNFWQQTDEEKGEWVDNDQEIEMVEKKTIEQKNKNPKIIVVLYPVVSKKKTQNMQTQTKKTNSKDKGVQTIWKLVHIDIERKSDRERLEKYVKECQFTKIREEFSVPQLLSPIKDLKEESIQERRCEEKKQRECYAKQIDEDMGNKWKNWNVNEFILDGEEENQKENIQVKEKRKLQLEEESQTIKHKNKNTEKRPRARLLKKDLDTLNKERWVNDEVVNAYFEMIEEQGKGRVYVMNTFFFPRLVLSGYQSVKRWTKRRPIIKYTEDKISQPGILEQTKVRDLNKRASPPNYYDYFALLYRPSIKRHRERVSVASLALITLDSLPHADLRLSNSDPHTQFTSRF
ncbi:ubiquitin-like-specific protease 1 [Venturia canescens]|uniref:ubiquitin-like-specific protease 1 n=1 Tax=Venturia canescens TaxID=32260 RepID=UPI001C9D0DE9|nr:ubiquitin-like-specific protease 1 [Venturia canescens]